MNSIAIADLGLFMHGLRPCLTSMANVLPVSSVVSKTCSLDSPVYMHARIKTTNKLKTESGIRIFEHYASCMLMKTSRTATEVGLRWLWNIRKKLNKMEQTDEVACSRKKHSGRWRSSRHNKDSQQVAAAEDSGKSLKTDRPTTCDARAMYKSEFCPFLRNRKLIYVNAAYSMRLGAKREKLSYRRDGFGPKTLSD